MNGFYQIFKRDKKTGRKSELVERYTSMTINLNWGEVGKFTLKGETVDTIELELGDYILVYRNYEQIFAGVVTNLSISCSDTMTNFKKWTATGKEDSIIFSYRVTVPDPTDLTFHNDYSDTCDDFGYTRILHYIRRNLGDESNILEITEQEGGDPIIKVVTKRELDGLVIPGERSLGNKDISSYRYKTLNTALKEIGQEVNSETGEEWGLYPIYVWDSETGEKRIEISELRDRTKDVYISPEFGNVTSWTKTSAFPKYNAVWVVSGSWDDEENAEERINPDTGEKEKVVPTKRIYVHLEDAKSVEKYGRIEKVETKSDIKVVKDKNKDKQSAENGGDNTSTDTNNDDNENDENGENGDGEEEEESKEVTEEQVIRLLKKEAKKLLKDNAETAKYKITMIETPELQYWDNWKCGDLVACEINGEKFNAIIKSVEISYEKGQEKVKPTVGEVEQGEFSELFHALSGMESRLTTEELKWQQ